MRYTLTNARPAAGHRRPASSPACGATPGSSQESQKSERRSADDALWRVPVPANGEAIVTATFDTRF